MPITASLDNVTQYIADLLTTNAGSLGLNKIHYGAQHTIGNFPVAVVEPVRAPKERHATNNVFLRRFVVHIWIAHATMSQTRSARTKADLLVAESVITLLETDFTAGGRVVDGFVTNSEPVFGVVSGAGTSHMVVGTRLTWEGESVK